MSRRRSIWRAVPARRLVQTVFLLAFLAGVIGTTASPGGEPPSTWLKAFFLIDPLLLLATWLSAHTAPMLLLASLGLVVLTLVLGRVF